ncbi:MAG: T9SS type A sorting domain-containing protein [Bacteroidia bacterium]
MDLRTSNDAILEAFYDSTKNTSMGQLQEAGNLLPTDTTAASALISSAVPVNAPEENERVVLEIYLLTIAKDIETFTPEQYQILYDIALQNPIWGGRAVYWARVLLELEVDDFYEDSMGGRFGQPKFVNLSGSSRRGKLFPNPANDYVVYKIRLNENESGEFQIFNVLCEKQKSFNLHEGENSAQIDTKDLEAGIYIYKVVLNNAFKEKGKLIVIH